MFLVTGITGKVGGAAARHLLKMGRQVRSLVRDEVKAAGWKSKGVELIKGEWEDAAAMTRALEGVEGAYLMMPPSQTPSPDFREAKDGAGELQRSPGEGCSAEACGAVIHGLGEDERPRSDYGNASA